MIATIQTYLTLCYQDSYCLEDTIDCFPCSTDADDCGVMGTCCPDPVDYDAINEDARRLFGRQREVSPFGRPPSSNMNFTNIPLISNASGFIREPYVQPPTSNKDLPYADYMSCEVYQMENGSEQKEKSMFTIRGCPESYLDDHVITMCTDTNIAVTPESYTRVSDPTTRAVYYNQYCAQCHGVPLSALAPWTLEIVCKHHMKVYSATSEVSTQAAIVLS